MGIRAGRFERSMRRCAIDLRNIYGSIAVNALIDPRRGRASTLTSTIWVCCLYERVHCGGQCSHESRMREICTSGSTRGEG